MFVASFAKGVTIYTIDVAGKALLANAGAGEGFRPMISLISGK